jgi:RNA polymerase I-specific transcription initiation factor RRN3
VFYIYCFRWKDLLDEADEDEIVIDTGRRWMMDLETIKRAVSSTFNPLKVSRVCTSLLSGRLPTDPWATQVCAQPVVNQFAAIAHKTNFLYCYHVIETNRRASSRESAAMPAPSGKTLTAPPPPLRSYSSSATITATPRQLLVAEEMDSFFPFDPFTLPMSSVYINGIYRQWEADDGSSTSGTSSGDSEDDSSDSDDDDDSSSLASDAEGEASTGGLAVPGLNRAGGAAGSSEDDDEVARSFEAMSLSLSPQHESFGGRRAADRMGSLTASLSR